MIKMRLGFYFEETGMSKADFARLCGTSKQNVNYWLKSRDVWVHCDEQMKVLKVEAELTKLLWEE